jgi:glycosyltransferase involved in cell wall biosynthesis
MRTSQGLFQDNIAPEFKISIVIPVRNEAENLAYSLAPFTRQRNLKPADQFEILILANNCTDNSVKIIQEFQRANPLLRIHLEEINIPKKNANIGFVRRLLMNEAFNRRHYNDH